MIPPFDFVVSTEAGIPSASRDRRDAVVLGHPTADEGIDHGHERPLVLTLLRPDLRRPADVEVGKFALTYSTASRSCVSFLYECMNGCQAPGRPRLEAPRPRCAPQRGQRRELLTAREKALIDLAHELPRRERRHFLDEVVRRIGAARRRPISSTSRNPFVTSSPVTEPVRWISVFTPSVVP